MPEYLSPGVYIEEIERGPRPIEGVPTSTAAFIGETERGPTRPRLISSYVEYKRWFGDVFDRDQYMPYATNGFFENGGRRLFVCRIVGADATVASAEVGNLIIKAVGAGSWGERVFVKIESGSTEGRLDDGNDGTKVKIGFRLRLAYWTTKPKDPFDPFKDENRKKKPRPVLTEDFNDLTLQPDSSDYFEKRLSGNSALVSIELKDTSDLSLPDPTDGEFLDGGADSLSQLTSTDYVGKPVNPGDEPQGLEALTLDPYREVALVHAPYFAPNNTDVAKAVIDHCERMRFRFAVLDGEKKVSDLSALDPRTVVADSHYAAIYHPWIHISDPKSGAPTLVPPGGYALGVYARTDTERGVYKAPANETVRGAVKLETDINDIQQETLNPRGVNAIRSFPGRGIRIWGARTLSSNGLWKYVSVRRLFIFLERSIYEGTQWVVFEPNDDRLWARVTDTIRLFLRSQWRNGALLGRTEKEAFFITCDRTTMTQDDILNGRLICEIGIAPVRPAEFVVFRIFQHTAEAQR
ncbi:hypothetical protein GCM10027431_26540 [Lysobacter rhizosphaerae]